MPVSKGTKLKINVHVFTFFVAIIIHLLEEILKFGAK